MFICLFCFRVLVLLTSSVCLKLRILLAFSLLLVLRIHPSHGWHWRPAPSVLGCRTTIPWTRSSCELDWMGDLGGGAHRTGINIARPEQWANEVTGLWWPHQPALHTPLTNSPFLETMTQPPTPMTLFPYSTLKKPCSQSSPKCLPEVQTAES